MTKFDDIYGGKWLKSGDLEDQKQKFQIESAEWQEVGKEKEEKLVLAFVGQPKLLILNSTNANALAEKWGKQEAAWVSRWVEVFGVETAMGPGVRVKPVEAPLTVKGAPPSGDDIPF